MTTAASSFQTETHADEDKTSSNPSATASNFCQDMALQIPLEVRGEPTIMFIASTSSRAVEDQVNNFLKMFGDEVRFSMTTDRSYGAGSYPLTIAFAEIGHKFEDAFIDTTVDSISEQYCDSGPGASCKDYGEGDAAYKKALPPAPCFSSLFRY